MRLRHFTFYCYKYINWSFISCIRFVHLYICCIFNCLEIHLSGVYGQYSYTPHSHHIIKEFIESMSTYKISRIPRSFHIYIVTLTTQSDKTNNTLNVIYNLWLDEWNVHITSKLILLSVGYAAVCENSVHSEFIDLLLKKHARAIWICYSYALFAIYICKRELAL